jgi:Ca-activated chloride channel family protein
MSCSRRLAARVCLVVWAVAAAVPALGQGTVIVPRPVPHPRWPHRFTTTPLVLKYQRVYADVTDGVAVTTVQQTFRNPLRHQVEGTYVFPLPDGVAVGDFSMTIGGKTLHGEVLDAETARRTYEDIVRRVKDPALLEYLGKRLWQAKIFPVPPDKELDVKLQYSQAVPETSGLGLYCHPLRAGTISSETIEQTVVQVKIRSQLPLTSVFCPSHQCDISRPNDHEATVTYEQSHARPDRDFLLYYQRKDTMFGLSLLTHRGPGEAGYFMMRISPRVEISDGQILPKDIAFVIDTSGSMQGGKIEQVKRSLKFCISALSERDRFNIYTFSTEVHPFREGLVPAGSDVKQAAIEFTDKIQALGGTNINQALLETLAADPRDDQRPYLIVFMTDGEPTVDVTDPNRILQNVADKNTARVRFHVLGVGTEVNTHLLDKLAEATRGTRDYCTENEDLELKLSAFVTRLANPVLTDIALKISGLNTTDVYPRQLPDLFRGNDLVVLGRYDGSGHHAVEFKGRLQSETKTITYEGNFAERESANDFLPRLWATRKVAYLLDQIRLHGRKQELVDEVIRLAKRHGIVTPYTSALILEDDRPIALRPPRERMLGGVYDDAARRGVATAGGGGQFRQPTGQAAVKASRDIADEAAAEAIAPLSYGVLRGERGQAVIRHVADRTFVLADERWTDTAWDGEKEPHRVTAYSDEYFELLKRNPGLAGYLTLGEHVLVLFDGTVYEVVPEPKAREGDEGGGG